MEGQRQRSPARFRPSRFDAGTYEDERGMRHWPDGPPERTDYRGLGPKGYQRSDERIREEVCERLTFSHAIDASEIEVHVSEGLVTLDGIVETKPEKHLAEDLVENLSGVKAVHNHLSVRKRVDGWISGLH